MKGIVKGIILLKDGKCIKDMNRYCPSISRTYNNLEYDTCPNGCNETETEKKERCMDGKYKGPGIYDNYVEPKRAVCERRVKINYDDIRTPSPTADSYRSCMNERNCESYNGVKEIRWT